ncbi:MAG TPA: serine/threonine-protein kinase [Candidatus Angelobacter sp.]
MAISPGIRLGPYEIAAPLGKGGMGEVYRAHDTRLDRMVAVKVLPLESMRDAERVQRFEQEAKAASGRNHPNILTIYDFGVADGTYYMATEYVEGHTLHELIAGGSMTLVRALDIVIQCANGLAAAHAAGVIHRDVKPQNIMVRPDGYVKILDFGLAKLTEKPFASDPNALTAAAGLTAPGLIMGTWLYMSPEQARGLELDARSDIWSLGAVLYEMVTGKSPFASQTMSDTLASILNREPEPLSSCGVDAPDELKHILAKALAKDRDSRYHSIKDMELDLKQLRKELELGTARTNRSGTVTVEAKSPGKVGSGPRSAGMSAGQKKSLLIASGVLAAALMVWAVVANRQPSVAPIIPAAPVAPVPERQLSYSLLVQKMREGKPYQDTFAATGREIFENGWKVQFDFSIPQAGSLYLLNDGPGPNGNQELSIVFPTPSVNNGSAQVMAYKNVQSGWLVFNNHAGREKFLVLWAVKPIPELEQSIHRVAKSRDPVIHDTQLTQAIRELLAKSPAATASVDRESKQTSLSGHEDVLVSELELEHQ